MRKYVFSVCTYKIINGKHGKAGCTRKLIYSLLTDLFFFQSCLFFNKVILLQNNAVDVSCHSQKLDISLFSLMCVTNFSGYSYNTSYKINMATENGHKKQSSYCIFPVRSLLEVLDPFHYKTCFQLPNFSYVAEIFHNKVLTQDNSGENIFQLCLFDHFQESS